MQCFMNNTVYQSNVYFKEDESKVLLKLKANLPTDYNTKLPFSWTIFNHGMKLSQEGLGWKSRKGFSPRWWLSSGTGSPGKGLHQQAWQTSRSIWTTPSGAWWHSWELSCAGPGAGIDDPCGSFSTQHILWF